MKKAVNNNRPGNMETMYEHRKNGLMGKIISYDDRAATLIIRLNDGKSKIMAWSTFRSDWRIAKAVETPVEEVKPVENKLVPMPGADLDPVEGRERGREQSVGDMKIKPAQSGHPAPNRNAQLQFDGRAQNICAWAKELGISANTLYGRIYKMGWSIEKAFTTPTKKNN